MSFPGYQHAINSGVYLKGVDSSRVGARLPVARDEIGDPLVLLIIGQSNGGNHGETRRGTAPCSISMSSMVYVTGHQIRCWAPQGRRQPLVPSGRCADRRRICTIHSSLSALGRRSNRRRMGAGRDISPSYDLRARRIAASRLLWHQGEADALYGTSADDYINGFRALVTSFRDLGIRAPIYVAIGSYFAVPRRSSGVLSSP